MTLLPPHGPPQTATQCRRGSAGCPWELEWGWDTRGVAWSGSWHRGLLPGKCFRVKVKTHIDFVPLKMTSRGSRSQEHWFKNMSVTDTENFKAKKLHIWKCCTPLQKRKKRGKAKQNPFPRSSYLQGSCSQWRIPALSPFVAFGVRERSHSKATIVFVSNCFFTARFAVLLVNYFTFSSREMQPYS